MSSLEAYLNEQINASSQSRTKMYFDASCSDDQQTAITGLIGLVMLDENRISKCEDFALTVEESVSNEELQEMITRYYTDLDYEVDGDCHTWVDAMKIRKAGEKTKTVMVTNDSGFASRELRIKGLIHVTVSYSICDR